MTPSKLMDKRFKSDVNGRGGRGIPRPYKNVNFISVLHNMNRKASLFGRSMLRPYIHANSDPGSYKSRHTQ